jgi:hypothetical protein
MKKKSKKTKKYLQAGGDLRSNLSRMPPTDTVGFIRDDGSATGQVKAISTAADRARDYLSTAGKALGENQSSTGTRTGPRPEFTGFSPQEFLGSGGLFGGEEGIGGGFLKGGKVKKLTKEEKELRDKNRRKMMKRSGLTSGPKKRKSSTQLRDDLVERELAREDAAREKYGDKGMAGFESRRAEDDAALQARIPDYDLIEAYGEDAPMSRSYGTPARKNIEDRMKKGGKVNKKKSYSRGGKVRGAGIAKKGVRPAKMVKMKGS